MEAMRPLLSRSAHPDLLAFLALPALALACALLANALASPGRRLAWTGRPLPPAEPPAAPTALPPRPSAPDAPALGSPAPATPAQGAPSVPKGPTTAQGLGQDPSAPLRELDGARALAAFRQGAVFLDARRSAEYEAGHVPGAWCAPVWEADLEDRILAFEAGVQPSAGTPLLLYCGGGDCEDAHRLARRLLELGYRNLWVHRGGWNEWLALKGPVRSGAAR
jgi:rhodanese-related sulfurtransferase